MGYPRKLLTEGEEIVFDLHPHWKVLVVPGLLAPVIVFMGSLRHRPCAGRRRPTTWSSGR